MADPIKDTQTKVLSKTGITGAILTLFGVFDVIKEAALPLLQGSEINLNWSSLVTLFGGIMVILFRKYSDGKIPTIV